MSLKLARQVDKALDARQRARLDELSGIEKILFKRLTDELASEITEQDGRITSKKGYVSLSKVIDRVFDMIQKKNLKNMGTGMARDMLNVLMLNANYYRVLAVNQGTRFSSINDTVDNILRQRLGIADGGRVQRNGYLEQLFQDQVSRDEVKLIVHKAVTAGVPMRKLTKALREKVVGTGTAAGTLESNLGGFVLDTYNLADSITNNEFGKRLGLQCFIYSGGLIETSREFCRKRNGKVFTTAEANKEWPLDSTLPRTKAERQAGGAPGDYIPLEDRGRYNCRHRLLYISNEDAVRRRPELASLLERL